MLMETVEQKPQKYYENTKYENYVLSKINDLFYEHNIEHNFVDLYWERKMYGKKNLFGENVIPNKEKMKRFVYLGDVCVLFPFLYYAFIDMMNFYKKESIKRNWNYKEMDLFLIEIKDVYNLYLEYIGRTLNSFVERHKNKKYFRYLSFEDFCALYLEENGDILMIDDFLESSLCPPTATGLSVMVGRYDVNNINQKIERFFQKESFLFFVESARRFGFLVDKNIPWRIVLDLNSYATSYYIMREMALENGEKEKLLDFLPVEEDYMKKNGKIDLVDFFDRYYIKTSDSSIRYDGVVLLFKDIYQKNGLCSEVSEERAKEIIFGG